jgi:hypothetical protein
VTDIARLIEASASTSLGAVELFALEPDFAVRATLGD